MNVPNYIRTEWRDKGHVDIKLADSGCRNCLRIWENEKEKEKLKSLKREYRIQSLGEYSKKNSVPNGGFSCTKTMHSAQNGGCSHTKAIRCYVSTLNVWEYEARKEISQDEDQNSQDFQDVDFPPTITSEIWNSWNEYWQEWKDTFVDASWIHRFPDYCKEDDRKWYNECCAIKMFVKDLNYGSIELESELLVSEFKPKSGPEFEKLVNDLYSEHSTKRYWVQFRLFVRDNNVEVNEELAEFFASHGLIDEPPILKSKSSEDVEVNEDSESLNVPLVNEHYETGEAPNGFHQTDEGFSEGVNESRQKGDSNEDRNVPCQTGENSNEHNGDELSKGDSDDVVASTVEECISLILDQEMMKDEEVIKSGSTDYLTVIPEVNDIDEQKVKENSNEENDLNYDEIQSSQTEETSFSSDKSNKSDCSEQGRKNVSPRETLGSKKKRSTHSGGAAWALEHIRQLSETQESGSQLQADANANKSTPMVLENIVNASMDIGIKPAPVSTSARPNDSQLPRSKRKYETLSDDSTSRNGNRTPPPLPKWSLRRSATDLLQAAFDTATCLWQIGSLYSKGIINIILFLLRLNPFDPDHPLFMSFSPYWWFGYSLIEETTIELAMRKAEKESINVLWKLFKPTLRHINFYPPLMTGENLHLTKVKKFTENRSIQEDLIKITQNSNPETKADKGLNVLYMTEEDLDYELENVVEVNHVSDEDDVHKNLTVHDEAEIEVPASEDRCVEKSKCEQVENNDWCYTKIKFDEDGNFINIPCGPKEPISKKITRVLESSNLMRFSLNTDRGNVPSTIADNLIKYWLQRYRIFLKYDEGIKLDKESWYSVTPEMIAAHQAERCRCDVVIDAFCGAGGNSIQLAATCNRVIAIDIDPAKIELARNNARVYGVEDRIEFIQGDFFELASTLQANVVFLSPPWGGINYKKSDDYDLYTMAGLMDGKKLFEAASKITSNVAMYLPKHTNVLQIIELAGYGGQVDIEYDHISNKRKSLTAYYGDLVNFK